VKLEKRRKNKCRLTYLCMRCFAERSGAKYGRATAGANLIHSVVRPE